MKEVAERIKLLRESVNLSQAKLAVLAEVTQSAVNRYENDQSAHRYRFWCGMRTILTFRWIAFW